MLLAIFESIRKVLASSNTIASFLGSSGLFSCGKDTGFLKGPFAFAFAGEGGALAEGGRSYYLPVKGVLMRQKTLCFSKGALSM